MKIIEIINEYNFHGRTCTNDCSGHKAGWYWSKNKQVTNPIQCNQPYSPSFQGGCNTALDKNLKHPRIRNNSGQFANPNPTKKFNTTTYKYS